MTAFGALFRATRQIFIGIDEIPSQVDLAHEGQKGIAVGWFHWSQTEIPLTKPDNWVSEDIDDCTAG